VLTSALDTNTVHRKNNISLDHNLTPLDNNLPCIFWYSAHSICPTNTVSGYARPQNFTGSAIAKRTLRFSISAEILSVAAQCLNNYT